MNPKPRQIRAGMVGLGMIFEETYRPLFESLRRERLEPGCVSAGSSSAATHTPGADATGLEPVSVHLTAVASRTGARAQAYLASGTLGHFDSFHGRDAVEQLLPHVDALCIATPDDRHYPAARAALDAGKHVLIEKPSVLTLQQLDDLQSRAKDNKILAKVVYHKLLDPDHKKMRTLVADGVLRHVNNGYCSLLEPKQISGSQFAEWITGRNPGTYVAVHYVKLIDFSFFGAGEARLKSVSATGQRGLVGPADGPTWDSVQLRVVYAYPDGREAAFDMHTSWVTPDNFPGYVEQEVQFRFDNAVWNAHQRKRGVEVAVEGLSPAPIKYTPNHHYNASFLEPWGARSQRGYGIETIRRFFEEVAFVEFGGDPSQREQRLEEMRALSYNDLSADRNTVAIVQALEAILAAHARGRPDGVVLLNQNEGGLVLTWPGRTDHEVLYWPWV